MVVFVVPQIIEKQSKNQQGLGGYLDGSDKKCSGYYLGIVFCECIVKI